MEISPSAKRTRRQLEKAFRQLLREKPFEEITATDIARRAGLSRNTFYKYFADKYAVYGALHEKIIEKLSGGSPTKEEFLSSEPPAQLIEAFKFARDDRRVRRLLETGKFAYVAREVLRKQISWKLRHSLPNSCGDPWMSESFYVLEFLANGQASLIIRCAGGYSQWSPLAFANACQKMRRAVVLSIYPSEKNG
jgi:AcrR family transcriptional regulator